MKNCENCPFDPNKPFRPFSNGSEAMDWQSRNCGKCMNYENNSTSEETAKCKLAYHIDFGFVSSEIPLWVAKEIGCDYNPLYGHVKLHNCRKKTTGNEPF